MVVCIGILFLFAKDCPLSKCINFWHCIGLYFKENIQNRFFTSTFYLFYCIFLQCPFKFVHHKLHSGHKTLFQPLLLFNHTNKNKALPHLYFKQNMMKVQWRIILDDNLCKRQRVSFISHRYTYTQHCRDTAPSSWLTNVHVYRLPAYLAHVHTNHAVPAPGTTAAITN